ncbi:MAG: cytochrome c peroxidase [Trueperaceae bacterium]
MGTYTVFADIVPAQPWHPVAAAYLRSTFYLNLGPQIDWDLVEREYTASISEEGYPFASVLEALESVEDAFDSTLVVPIEQAIGKQNPSALFDATTRAVSQTVRFYVSQAEEKLSSPGAALQDVLAAQQVYRAFGQDFISEADPEAFGSLGRAWLDMAHSAGNAGIVGLGGTAADPGQFAAAKAVIEPYLITNFEDGGFVTDTPVGQRFAPIPVTAENAAIPVWTPPGTNLNDQVPLPLLRLNFEARGFDEADIPLVAFGDMVFDSPEVFGGPARSIGLACATCHNRSDINRSFFIPGISHQPGAVDVDGAFFNPYFNDQRSDSLDIPSLRGLRFTAPYGRDGRFGSLRAFLRNVHVQEFGGPEPTEFMLDALVAYVLEFDFLPNSYLNADGTLTERASESARRGQVIFETPYEGMMGGMSCAACHTQGSLFADGEQWNIGSINDASGDYGFANYLETPTLLNSAYTSPYFHDGSLATLEDVANWKNRRFQMDLDDQQLADLSEYLRTVGAADEPYEVFDDENTPFQLAWGELTTFATTLGSMLIPRQDSFHARLLIDTVAPDLRADSSGLQDYGNAGLVFEVADKLDEIKAAIEQDDWALAESRYEEYEELVEEYGPVLR